MIANPYGFKLSETSRTIYNKPITRTPTLYCLLYTTYILPIYIYIYTASLSISFSLSPLSAYILPTLYHMPHTSSLGKSDGPPTSLYIGIIYIYIYIEREREICVCMYVCVCVCMYVCTYVRMYVGMYECMNV